MSADLASAAIEGFGVLLRGMTAPRTLVYPAYIATRIKKAIFAADTEQVVSEIGELQTIGDCRYALTITDFNGSRYRITVDVEHTAEAAE